MVNAYPHQDAHKNNVWTGQTKAPDNQHLRLYMSHLQPHTDEYGTYCAATLLPAFASHVWFLVPCDEQYKARLVCQVDYKESPSTQHSLVYCMGQIAILSRWCVVHVTFNTHSVQNAKCLAYNSSEIVLESKVSVIQYKQKFCPLFEQICNATDEESIIMINDIKYATHACIMPMPNVTCPHQNFQYKDLSCIPKSEQCNNIQDCPHGEDEDDCSYRGCEMSGVNCQVNCTWPQCKCAFAYFQCDSGGCVPAGTVCDFQHNCLDGSDELYCGNLLCPDGQLPCADNRACVDAYRFFNGIEDCMDASDEYIHHNETCPGFQCKDLTCIPSIWLDDGVPDCPYGEDEEDFMLQRATGKTEWPCPEHTLPCRGSVRRCYPQEQQCVYETDSHGKIYTCRNAGHLSTCDDLTCANMYKCSMSYCISFNRVCDGVIDCQDSSDENNCPTFSCPGMFRCIQEHVCIQPQDVCDGKIHCKMSQDDEKYCNDKVLKECTHCTDFPERLHMVSLLEHIHVRMISLQNSEIRELVSSTVTTHTSFIVMNLANNLIITLPSFGFHCFPYLQYIFLNHNEIQHIANSAFFNIRKLRILDLSNNKLSSLSISHFKGLYSINILDLSNNHLTVIEERLFDETQIQSSLIVTNDIICCMIQSHVTCKLEQSIFIPFCQDLFLHAALSYIVSATACIILFSNGLSVYVLLQKYKRTNVLIINLSMSDALCGIYLTALASSDFYYRNRFSFYEKLWPTSIQCYIAMFAFFVSFQQSILSLILISCHACILIASPFKKEIIHKYFVRAVLGSWIVVIVELVSVLYLQNTNRITIESSHLYCQSPVLASNIIIPTVALSCLVSVLLIFTFCACFLCAIVLIKHGDKALNTACRPKQTLKQKMIRKFISALIINFLSLSSVVTVECLMMSGLQIEDLPLITLTLSIMSLNKICNPWIYILHNWVQQKLKKV